MNDAQEAVDLNYRLLAVECGCVCSMYALGSILSECVNDGRKIHVGNPWLLEGVIRGSGACRLILTTSVYEKAKLKPPNALRTYWLKMQAKFNTYNRLQFFDNSMVKQFKNGVGRYCVIFSKEDSKTLVLQHCKGCSLYCYCSETCQTSHWEEHNHRGEYKQLNILNKNHKPYAKEVCDSAICGNNHPALDKLRHKLGLSRPVEEYKELQNHSTHDGQPIEPFEYLVGREVGTVWVGSTSHPIGSYSERIIVKKAMVD
jgi:hypothetical protein